MNGSSSITADATVTAGASYGTDQAFNDNAFNSGTLGWTNMEEVGDNNVVNNSTFNSGPLGWI